MAYDFWKLDGGKVPAFCSVKGKNEGEHVLNCVNTEWGDHAWDTEVGLGMVIGHPEIALIGAVDGRGTTDGSPAYRKFLAYSFTGERDLFTAYLAYTFSGKMKVETWDKEKRASLRLDLVDFEHFDITPDRTPNKLIAKHLERIQEIKCVREGVAERAEKRFFDMLWNVSTR